MCNYMFFTAITKHKITYQTKMRFMDMVTPLTIIALTVTAPKAIQFPFVTHWASLVMA